MTALAPSGNPHPPPLHCLTRALGDQASKHAEAYLLIEGYWIPHGCESSGDWSRHACPLPGTGDFEAVGAVVERAPDDKRLLDGHLVETGADGFVDVLIDGMNRVDPLAHIERPELIAVGGEAGLRSDRLRVDKQAVDDEGGVDIAQSVHDALEGNASQGPAAERDIEALARLVERLGIVDGEADPLALLGGQCVSRGRNVLGVGIERVDRRGALGGEGRQPTFAAADVEDTLAVDDDEFGDRGGLDSGFVTGLH